MAKQAGESVTTSSSTCRSVDLKTSIILSTELIFLVNRKYCRVTLPPKQDCFAPVHERKNQWRYVTNDDL